MIGQKKRLTASAARRKHSVTAAIFDCCTLICRIGEKLAVYPSQMPRVLYDIPSVEKKDAEAYLLQHNSFVRSENMKIRGQDDFSIWPLIIYSSEYFTQ